MFRIEVDSVVMLTNVNFDSCSGSSGITLFLLDFVGTLVFGNTTLSNSIFEDENQATFRFLDLSTNQPFTVSDIAF